jgi:hypothetical protein
VVVHADQRQVLDLHGSPSVTWVIVGFHVARCFA